MPRRGAGRFLTVAEFQVRAHSRDQYGNQATAWATYITRRGLFAERPLDEEYEGGVLQGHTRATLRVRMDDQVRALPTDARVRIKNRIWSVVGVAEGDRHTTDERHTALITLDAGVADGGTTPPPPL